MDIDIYRLFDVLNEQAVSMIGPEKEPAVIAKAKEFLQSMIELVPNHPIAHYNLACAQSLLGEVKESIESLRQAILGGYNDVKHMLQDVDLENVRNRLSAEFQNLVAFASGEKNDTKASEEADWVKVEMEEEPEQKEEEQAAAAAPEIPKVEDVKMEEAEKKVEEPVQKLEQPPKEEEKKQQFTGKWAQQHEALAAMGFTIYEVNNALLEHYKGDVIKVVNALLNQ